MDLKPHDAALLFPEMTVHEFEELMADVQRHGQRQPIELFDGKILDGRHRYKACIALGMQPRTCNKSLKSIGGDPVGYVMSLNLHRRQLTASQRAMIATEAEQLYAKMAKERQGARNDLKQHSGASATMSGGKAREQAAKATGVGARSISAAKAVKKLGCPELQAAVCDGKVTVKVAENFARTVPIEQQPSLVQASLLEEKPDAFLKAKSKKRQVKPTGGVSKAAIKGAAKVLDDLQQRLERCGVLSSVHKHVNAIREALENVKQ